MNENNIFVKIGAFLLLWQSIALLIAILPVILKMQDMSGEPEDLIFLAEWLTNWLTSMIQLPSLALSIITYMIWELAKGRSSNKYL